MKSPTSLLNIDDHTDDEIARAFCDDFLSGAKPRYIFGRNEYATSIAQAVDVDGFIDDFTDDQTFLNKPIIRIEDVPKNALVVSAVVLGRPLTAEQRLKDFDIRSLDFFAFTKYAEIAIIPIMFWDEFPANFKQHRGQYEWVYNLLQDNESKRIFTKIINFRLSGDLSYMHGFTDIQYRQYFEDFLALKPDNEVFVDVGGFDGYTSIEFIKRCPAYGAVHVFEPEPGNMATVRERLGKYENVKFHTLGLSNQSQMLRFAASGSASRISDEGDIEIEVARLDDVLKEPFTYIKMDVEGGEKGALEGAKQSIIKHHPRLAISVYHRCDDFWKIPQQILSYRDDYKIFLRHYTEGITETVMFFIPKEQH